jgi:hypothetical protein
VIVENGKAVGVERSAGRRVEARQAVVCNVTPTQLYQRLLPTASIPENIGARARAFTYGRADMRWRLADAHSFPQVSAPRSEPKEWCGPPISQNVESVSKPNGKSRIMGFLDPSLEKPNSLPVDTTRI